ncbi:carbohydrate esterase family 4 protein [Crepidotus variabilis]|uniref:Carbohydrate esterase family 4 protein n=1 Tax=Crepidotus variabilis TaxID=179855 RepID=A0A9P6JW10_9AGAR|nr:carbohydrate esterase family 4 protein [Crepidotus variabilis]
MFAPLAFVTMAMALVSATEPSRLQKRQNAQVVTNCVKPNTVALTFDDGPWIYLQDISNTLKAANATGTFFFNGNNWGCIYDQDMSARVQYAYKNGHQIASHTWSHADLTTLSWDNIHNEMWLVEQALTRIAGVTPAFMRPPYGNYNDLVLQASYIRKQVVTIWDFDDGDSTGASAAQSESDYDALVRSHPGTVLSLNHETQETTAHQVLPYAIQKLKAAGYQLVSLADCTGLPAYQFVGSPQTRTSDWHC